MSVRTLSARLKGGISDDEKVPGKLKDLPFKELFSDPALIAFLATQVIDEYKGKDPPPVKAIQRLDTELHIAGHGFSRPDLVWHLPRPDLKGRCIMSIDLQNNSTPGYSLSRRIEYQGAKLLVTQPGSILPVKLDYNGYSLNCVGRSHQVSFR